MLEISALRQLDHALINKVLDKRDFYRRSSNYSGRWRGHDQAITGEIRENCHSMCDFLQAQKDYKIMLIQDWGYLYTNNLELVRSMERLAYITPRELKQVSVDLARDTMLIRNSTHQYRSYFRTAKINSDQKNKLCNFLLNQDNIRMSPMLNKWPKNTKHYYIEYIFFIDHDNISLPTMLSLIQPDCIRKTVRLVRYK